MITAWCIRQIDAISQITETLHINCENDFPSAYIHLTQIDPQHVLSGLRERSAVLCRGKISDYNKTNTALLQPDTLQKVRFRKWRIQARTVKFWENITVNTTNSGKYPTALQ